MTAPLNSNNPNVLPIEDARQGIQTFAMYYYQSLLNAGYQPGDAKEQVASLLEKQYHFFCDQAGIPVKSLGTVGMKVDKVTEQVKELAKTNHSLRSVYNELLVIQKQLKR